MVDVQTVTENVVQQGVQFLPRLAAALVVFIIGLTIIRLLVGALTRQMKKHDVDPSLRPFLRTLLRVLLQVMLVLTVLSMMGVQVTSFVAILGAAGLAVGLALKDGLANFAGGVMILVYKPFKVGDVIEAQGFIAKVHEIRVFHTVLKTADNKTIILPNGPLSNGNLVNYTTEPNRRVDMTFGIGYQDDIEKAKVIIQDLIETDERIFKDPTPQVVVSALADSSVNLAVRVWCKGTDYWDVFFLMQERVKQEFDRSGVSIPFPQRDVHLYKE